MLTYDLLQLEYIRTLPLSVPAVLNTPLSISGAACTWVPVPEDTAAACPQPDQVMTGYCDSLGTASLCLGGTVKAAMECCTVTGLSVDTGSCLKAGMLDGDSYGSCEGEEPGLGYYGLMAGSCYSTTASATCGGFQNEVCTSRTC